MQAPKGRKNSCDTVSLGAEIFDSARSLPFPEAALLTSHATLIANMNCN